MYTKPITTSIVILFYLFITIIMEANTGVIINDDFKKIKLWDYVGVLEDEKKNIHIEDILLHPDDYPFNEDTHSFHNSYKNTSYWLKLDIVNRSTALTEFYLSDIDNTDKYKPQSIIIYDNKTGDVQRLNLTRRDYKCNHVLDFSIWPNQDITIYLHYTLYDFFNTNLHLLSKKQFVNEVMNNRFIFGIVVGIALIMLLYNLIIYFIVRNKNYLYYVLFIFIFILFDLIIHNALCYFFPALIVIKKQIYYCHEPMLLIFFHLFVRGLLQLKKTWPILDKIIIITIILVCFNLIVFIFTDILIFFHLRNIFFVPYTVLTLYIAIKKSIKGDRSARYFLLATGSIFLLSQMILLSVYFKFIPDGSKYYYDIGMTLLLFLFATALADRINTITKEKQIVQQQAIKHKNQAIENLKKVDLLKDEFLTNTSHELRTPLHSIIGITASLIEGVTGELPEDTLRNLAMIHTSGKRLYNLVNDILDFSKIKNNELGLQIKPLDITLIIDYIIRFSRHLIGTKDIAICNDIKAPMPPVDADENRVQQILFNLIGNAIKFTDSGTITISAEKSKDFLIVNIQDTGIGIPPDKQNDIFNSFEQMDGSISRKFGGTGLGLTITKKLIELHGGKIWVESQPGSGSTFSFSLPFSRAAVSEAVIPQDFTVDSIIPDTRITLEIPSSSSSSVKGKTHTILIVDDDLINIQIIKNHLFYENYSFIEATTGLEALKIIKENDTIDLVLLDIMMPGMSGYDVCRKLRADYTLYELPVLMLTARSRISDLEEAFESGTNDFLTKPFNSVELRKRVATLLSVNRLTKTNFVLQSTNELKSRLIKIAAHDIKNPVNAIQINTNILLKSSDITDETVMFIDLIKKSSMKINSLITNLLDNAKIQEGKLLLQKVELNIIEVLLHVIDSFHQQAQFKNQQILFNTYTDTLMMYADQTRIEQIFSNILSNAIKYSLKDKKIYVKVIKSPRAKHIRVSIIDEGPGFTEEDKQFIFKEFQKLSAKPTAGESSTGIGLSIVKGLIDLHKGYISLESEAGNGAAFIVDLPCE